MEKEVKEISNMTEKEILRKQLELLAENSENRATAEELPRLTEAMCQLYYAFLKETR